LAQGEPDEICTVQFGGTDFAVVTSYQRTKNLDEAGITMTKRSDLGKAVVLMVVGCGGDFTTARTPSDNDAAGAAAIDDSEIYANGGASDSGPTDVTSDSVGGAATGGTLAAADEDPQEPSSSGACPIIYYRDADADSWGSTETSCTGRPGWVTRSGDCNDSNADVFPSQSVPFAAPYSNSVGLPSFDYDCDGVETLAAGIQASPGECTNAGLGNACAGDGYLPCEPARTGVNLNPICGSARYLSCSRTQQICVGATSTDGSYPAVRCK
jgi:hypothetical protein